MEDSGYLPRLAMMVNRTFRLIGLNGKAVLPMVLGLGCDTMATMTARILQTRKERLLVTILLALGIPCSAQLGVIMGMAASLSIIMAVIIAVSVLSSMLVVGYVSSRVLPGVSSDFIQEIPPIRIPVIRNILVKTGARVRWYLREAVPLFMLGTFFLFLLSRLQILTWLETASAPVIVNLLGLPVETTRAFLVGFLRRDYAATELFVLSKTISMDPIQIVVGLVTITLFVPCIAHFFIIIKEQGIKNAVLISAFVFGYAIFGGSLLNMILRIPFIERLLL
jgi:ferrous iron transport protein B